MKTEIEIIQTKYFAELRESMDWNSKVVYKKRGKTYVACFYVCTFRREIDFPLIQENGHKVLKGLKKALLNEKAFSNYC